VFSGAGHSADAWGTDVLRRGAGVTYSCAVESKPGSFRIEGL
jgi:hypothetical protein